MSRIDLCGQRFGRLLVKSRFVSDKRESYWICLCDCGKELVVRGNNLRTGHTKSCGCLHDELSGVRLTEQNRSHGESDTRLYRIWSDLRKRCENPHHWAFDRYGGRGVLVCEDWKSYQHFAVWAKANGYTKTLTIDRIDNDGNYCPENCRWVDMKKQYRNKSNNVRYAYDGKNLTVPEWSEITGINQCTLYNRLTQYGWSVERALTTPVREHKRYDS